jgi:cupin fold WbuC family metalloprotein
MDTWLLYIIIAVTLVVAELIYFRVADKYKLIDNQKDGSSPLIVGRREGGIVFLLSIVTWGGMMSFQGNEIEKYLPFLCGLLLVAGVSFWSDIRSVPDSVRIAVQFVAMGLMFWTMDVMYWDLWWKVLIALVLFVGVINVIGFMDGVNGITAGYSLVVLLSLFLLNEQLDKPFILDSLLGVSILAVLVFGFYNFRPTGKAKVFAGSVGSVGIAFIMLFALGKLIIQTSDLTWMIFLVVYGIDGCLTVFHQLIRHEGLGRTHRKHAYQLMANELGMNHVKVSLFYMGLQLAISLIMIYLIPNTAEAHWIYLVVVALVLSVAYILFIKKYYHLYEAYLQRQRLETTERITPDLLDQLTTQAETTPSRCMDYELGTIAKSLSQRTLVAIEPDSAVQMRRPQKSPETVVCLRGRLVEEFYDDLERRCVETIELSPKGPVVALNIPAGQWHTERALESGTLILVVKDGKPETKKQSLVYINGHYEMSR